MMCGGFREEQVCDHEIQEILDSVREEAEKMQGKSFSKFNGVRYTSQVVAGTNFIVKTEVDDGVFIHIKIHKPLPHTRQQPSIMSIQSDRVSDSSPIEYFEN